MNKLTKYQIVGILVALFGVINNIGLWVIVGILIILNGDNDD